MKRFLISAVVVFGVGEIIRDFFLYVLKYQGDKVASLVHHAVSFIA